MLGAFKNKRSVVTKPPVIPEVNPASIRQRTRKALPSIPDERKRKLRKRRLSSLTLQTAASTPDSQTLTVEVSI